MNQCRWFVCLVGRRVHTSHHHRRNVWSIIRVFLHALSAGSATLIAPPELLQNGRFQRVLSLLGRLSAELQLHLHRRPPRKRSLQLRRARRRLRVRSSAVCERGLH
ncbi:hypothetical protein SRHO_G00000730 [Serrasalmus rhombeus]